MPSIIIPCEIEVTNIRSRKAAIRQIQIMNDDYRYNNSEKTAEIIVHLKRRAKRVTKNN